MCDLLTDVGNYISFETTCDNPIRNPLLLVARLSPMHVDARGLCVSRMPTSLSTSIVTLNISAFVIFAMVESCNREIFRGCR